MAASTPRLFLLDGMALTYRAHFALIRSPQYNSRGLCTSAVMGVTNTILDLLNREKPTHLVAAFDTSAPTFRHEEFADYKAQRQALPEDIEAQLPYLDRLLEALRIPVLRVDGYEADDVLATLGQRAVAAGFESYHVTPDKDFDQLVGDGVFVYKPGRQGGPPEIRDRATVLEHWQIERIDQVVDILGLMGDKSDNIPGVPGVGEKTAQKLIAHFDTVENLLEHTSELKGKQKEKVEANRELALLSKRLVTIRLDVPLEVELDELRVEDFDKDKVRELFLELEFETLGKRLLGKSFSAAPGRAQARREERREEIKAELPERAAEERTIADVEHDYRIARTKKERAALIARLLKCDKFCFDTETTGLDPREAQPLGIAFSTEAHSGDYVVCPDAPDQIEALLEEFRPVFESEDGLKVGHNLKYDLTLLRWRGIRVRGRLFDTMLAHSMKEPELRQGLDELALLYLGYRSIPTSQLIGPRGEDQKSMKDVPLEELAEYAVEDADITLQLSEVIEPDLEARGVREVATEVECPLTPVLCDMEFHGIRLDREALAEFSGQLECEIEALRRDIQEAAGREFNVDSPKQLGVVLYEDLRLVDKPRKTPTGQYSTREQDLQRLATQHQIVRNVLDYRTATKLKSVYVDQLPAAVREDTGRLHTHYSQSWTATGRMQSANPNLQTIPIRKERGREIRAAFVPRDEHYLILSADYSQIELRIMAALSGDEGLREAFVNETDIHAVTASKVFKVGLEEVTRAERDKAKAVNFGIIYGISAFGLKERLDIPQREAQVLIDSYFDKYPGVRAWIDQTIDFARREGYVKTLTGRRRYLRDINSRNRSVQSAAERLAMNSPIQGTAADLLKLAMIKVHRVLEEGGFETKMLLTVHDEIVFDLHQSERETVPPLIEDAMKTALELDVPIAVEIGIGKNWLEAH